MAVRLFLVYCIYTKKQIGSLSARDEVQAQKLAVKFFGLTATTERPNET
jgi:hypothetical protein